MNNKINAINAMNVRIKNIYLLFTSHFEVKKFVYLWLSVSLRNKNNFLIN
jgi:hypothetical protein